jgi:hypothetical protein
VKRLLILLILLGISPLFAHEMRPAFLELKQMDSETYETLWKVPALQDSRLALYVNFPEKCGQVGDRKSYFSGGSYVEKLLVRCKDGLTGSAIQIDGLSATMTDVLVRIQRLDGTT